VSWSLTSRGMMFDADGNALETSPVPVNRINGVVVVCQAWTWQ
jgi:hypothetical protein